MGVGRNERAHSPKAVAAESPHASATHRGFTSRAGAPLLPTTGDQMTATEMASDEDLSIDARDRRIEELERDLAKAREVAGLLAAYSTTAGAADHACKVHGAQIVELRAKVLSLKAKLTRVEGILVGHALSQEPCAEEALREIRRTLEETCTTR